MKETAIIILLTSVWISNIFFISCGIYPEGLHPNKTTTCEEFSKFARFNPYSVLFDEWMVFYYWAPPQAPMIVKFSVPRKIHIDYLKYILEGHVLEPINWTAKSLLMTERDNRTYFLVEQSDRGHYLLYEPYKGLKEGDIIDAVDVRIKQTGDNRYIGIMACEAQTVFMFARVKDVPKRKYIQIEAARLNYKGRGGRSYLYQGHQWMPMPEAEDDHFEHVLNNRDKYSHK